MEAVIWAGQEEMKVTISEQVESNLASVDQQTQSLREELDAQIQGTQLDMKAVRASVDRQIQSLHEELNMEISGIQFNIQVTKVLAETTQQAFRMQLAEVEARVGCGDYRNTATGSYGNRTGIG
jgi:CRISPR/Cas system-associated exonuclease Cas4 (RecB family)